MAENFQEHAIAAGHDNTASLSSGIIEDLSDANGIRFVPVEDIGFYNPGEPTIRSDTVIVPQGYASFKWKSGHITLAQYYYLYNTLLSGAMSGKVTVKTRKFDLSTYLNVNATLTLPWPDQLTKGSGGGEYVDFVWTFTRVTEI